MDNLVKNVILFPFNILYKISPEKELALMFRLKLKYKLRLQEPKTYNEKLQWIKLYDKNSLMPKCCDKFTVREYVRDVGCGEILNNLIWEGFNPEDIPFDSLPERFVIKVTHGSSFNIICKDKTKLNRKKTTKQLKKWLKAKFIPCYGEWYYGVERPRVIVEDFIESDDGEDLKDYKVFCFGGVPKVIMLHTGRYTDHKCDTYNADWSFRPEVLAGFANSGEAVQPPACLDKLLEYSKKLSAPFKHARVDFYIVGDRIIFGEVTFNSGSGFDARSPMSFEYEMGEWLDLKYDGKSKE